MNTTRTPDTSWQQLANSLVMGLVVLGTVLAALVLSAQEAVPGAQQPTAVAIAPTAALSTTPPATVLLTPVAPPPTTASTPIATLAPSACPIPAGWLAYTVRANDTLASIAGARNADVFELIDKNCLLLSQEVTPGQVLYLPRAPMPTAPRPAPTSPPCGPPWNWPIYRVQPGDTLYGLAVRYGVSVSALAKANCLSSYILRVNQPLFVPFQIVVPPTATRPPATATPTAPAVSTPTASATRVTPPSSTPTTPPSATPAPSTATPAPSTATPAPSTATPAPSTATRTPTGASPTVTVGPSPTLTQPSTPASPTPTAGATASATPPPSPSATVPPSAVPSATATVPPPTATVAPATATAPPPTIQAPASATPGGAKP